MHKAGIVGLSDDGMPVMNPRLMRRAMEYGRMLELPVLSHCEDHRLSSGGVMHEGVVSTALGLIGVPAVAENVMVYRDIQLAALTGAHLHIQHVSTAEAVDLVRRAKEQGITVTAEACPHHFTLTHEAVQGTIPIPRSIRRCVPQRMSRPSRQGYRMGRWISLPRIMPRIMSQKRTRITRQRRQG